MILIKDKNRIELTAILKDITTIKDIKIRFNLNGIHDILSITYVSKKYINDRCDNGTEDLITLKNNTLILIGKRIKFIIRKDEFLELISKEFNVKHELLLGTYRCKIDNVLVDKQLYYDNGTFFEKIKILDL